MRYLQLRQLIKEEISKVLKENVDYEIKLLVPRVYWNNKTSDLSNSKDDFRTRSDRWTSKDVTVYKTGDDLDEWVFSRDYETAKYFEKEFPGLFKVIEK
jgi:hypothetical protein